jgi:deoxyadenosine/deoxycytidine kinase
MGKLIVVAGNSGVGGTTLAEAFCPAGNFATGLEGHATRLFQALFKNDAGFALANQIDYLLVHFEQETVDSHCRMPVELVESSRESERPSLRNIPGI